ncbi:Bax inhibitor-1/YccA family protein [Fluviispira sanaruensis]|uniref:BAX inhibitor (BI)-1/YccA family protein n=1 Tax=Fluviispira sanaruensis TaxID=2493639 RepID=A0A4P2VUU6_FLUSA|nr:Bax inhibitor-1/YccA family protein [Fluviispira sanaruensis]BBH53285.1 BAX inhibitor (BI)-1/YccA family protein [Fluviispira sanaruensis]
MRFNRFQKSNDNWMNTAVKNEVVQSSASKTIAGVYGWMTLGVFLSALTGVGLIQTGAIQTILSFGRGAVLGLFLVQMALVMGMSFAAEKLSSQALKGMFLLYSLLTGITFSIIMVVYPIGNVISLFFVAALGFAGLALFGAVTKKNLGFMSTFLFMGVLMIVGASVVNIFVQSEMLNSFAGWAGILVFSGLTAYDSQRIREGSYALAEQTSGNSEALGKFMIFGALTMYLNFINLFISLLRIFGGRRD